MDRQLLDLLDLHSVGSIHQRALSYFLPPENTANAEDGVQESDIDSAIIYKVLYLQSVCAIHRMIRNYLQLPEPLAYNVDIDDSSESESESFHSSQD